LDDSNYDIMSDVYALSTILFDSAVKPQETRFYKMPSVNYQSIVNDSDVSMQIDWFSPYNTYIVNT
jgi:type IV secretory pathway TrbF-like protein